MKTYETDEQTAATEPIADSPTHDPQASPAEDVATKAGRGTIYITGSKLWFMATGAAIMFLLPRVISQEQIGVYKVVIGLISIINAMVVTGTVQTVSKFVSQTPEHADAIKMKAIQLQCALGLGAAAAFAIAAPAVAASFSDPSLTPYLRIAALITAGYTFYAVFVGTLNGRKEFLRQAGLDALYSTAKMALIIASAFAFGLTGAIFGFAAAAFVVLIASAFVVGLRGRASDSPIGFGNLLQFQIALIAFLAINNLLMKTDLFLVKATISTDPQTASAAAGAYGAALDFAYIIFQIIISLTFIIFPLVSEAVFKADLAAVRGYVQQTLRATLIISTLPAVLFSANAVEVLQVVYPPEYAAGAPALRIVALGMLSFAIITMLTSVISSSGRPWVSVSIVATTCALSAALNLALIPRFGLAGAAMATSIAMLVGAIACAVFVKTRYGGVVSIATLARVAAAGAVVYAISLMVPSDAIAVRLGLGGLLVKLAVVVEFTILGFVYLAVLIATREIGADEVRLGKKILGIT